MTTISALKYVSNRLERVRHFAKQLILLIFERFPGILWNQNVFNDMLKQLQHVVDSIGFNNSDNESVRDICALADKWVLVAGNISQPHIFIMIQSFLAINMNYDSKSSLIISNLLLKIESISNFQYLGSKFTGELEGRLEAYKEGKKDIFNLRWPIRSGEFKNSS